MKVSDSDFKQQFNSFISLCNEDFLIRHSNKGLCNRAKKEIEKGTTVTYQFDLSDQVVCELSDQTICHLSNSLDTWTCSCPSSQICKHVLIAIVYYREHLLAQDASEDQANLPDFSWLLDTPITELLRSFTPTMIDEVAFRLRYEEQLQITASSLLTVHLGKHDAEVAFTSQAGKILCSVKDREGELLKLEALLRYRASEGIDDTPAFSQAKDIFSFSAGFIEEGMELLTRMLRIGIARLPEQITSQLETMSVSARSANLPNIERGLLTIKTELELYFARHITFSMDTLLGQMTEMYLALTALQKQLLLPEEQRLGAVELKQLTGSFRSKYYEIPKLHLYGLGAEPWQTKSLYKGITYYFYSLDDGHIHTYTESRPIYYRGVSFDYHQYYVSHSPWLSDLSMKQFAKSTVTFTRMKVNEERRLSSGSGAKLSVTERQPVGELRFGAYEGLSVEKNLIDNISSLFVRKPKQYAFLRVQGISEVYFDELSQHSIMSVQLEDERQLQFTIPFQSQWEKALKRLEQKTFYEKQHHFTAFVRIEGDFIYPISFLSGGHVTSLLLDL